MMNCYLTDKDVLTDALATQKYATANYNLFANECANAELRSQVIDLLNDEHLIQSDLFTQMNKRGWYPVPQAECQKIQQAIEKFQNA